MKKKIQYNPLQWHQNDDDDTSNNNTNNNIGNDNCFALKGKQ